MSLLTDIIFVKALRSNQELMAMLPDGDVHNTTIALPDKDLDNAPLPYIIVSYDGMQNAPQTKDAMYEDSTDKVVISVEVAAKTRPDLGRLMTTVRKTIKEFFINAEPSDEDYSLVPLDYTLSASQVNYDPDKPCCWQTLQYQCETNATDDDEQESN